MAKGNALIENDPLQSDTSSKPDYSFYNPQNHEIAAYHLSHLDASLNFKFAAELKYEILSKNLKICWSKYKGDPKAIEWLSAAQSNSYNSLIKADAIREKADMELRISAKLPMLKMAESLEKEAEFQMEKVLFVLQNLPVDPIKEWLISADTTNPLIARTVIIKDSLNKLIPENQLNAGLVKDTSLYSLLHITEQQVDLFNDFLLQKFPNQVENFVINFEQMTPAKIDSLQEEWNNFELAQYVTSDTSFANAISRKNSPIQSLAKILKDARNKRLQIVNLRESQNKNTPAKGQKEPDRLPSTNNNASTSQPDFFYRVQIAASRDELTRQEMKRRWEHPEKILVSYEDDWYKYTLGSFSDYRSARELKDGCQIKGAFVVAYLNGKRIKITPYLLKKGKP